MITSTVLPAGWVRVHLHHVARIENGADYKAVEVEDGGYPVYGSGGVFRRTSGYLYDGESVLFGRKGTIDKPLHVTGRFWTVDTMFYTRLSDRIVGRFLYYVALTIPYDYYSTSTALPSMTQGDLGGHPIPYPSLDEQRAIADYLDDATTRIDNLIAKQHEMIAFLGERRVAAIERGTSNAGPDIRLGRCLSLLRDGTHGTIPRVAEGVPLLSAKNISTGELVLGDDESYISREEADAITRSVAPQSSDVLLTIVGATIGRIALYSLAQPMPFQRSVAVLRVSRKMDARFVRFHLMTRDLQSQMKLSSNTSAQPGLYLGAVAALRISAPPLDEQRQIADRLDTEMARIDALIAKTHEHIALAKERRSALITAAVTGQFDVRTATREVA